MRRIVWLLPVALVAAGFALAEDGDGTIARGKELFHDTQDLGYASCAMCHSVLPPEEEAKKAEHLGPGASLWGAARRAGWRNGESYDDLAAALQPCAKWWQKRERGFAKADAAALAAYVATFGPADGKALPRREVQEKPPLLRDVAGGDPARGKKLLARYCAGCHNETDDALSFEIKPGRKRTEQILRKVRGYDGKGKFDPTATSMGYYTTDRLSDEDLRHILAYAGK